MTSSFSNLSLAEPLARAVAEMGYETMTPIQEQAIPVVLAGQDVMGAAQKIGDDALQRSAGRAVVPDSFTHGTSAQRQRWFGTGFKSGNMQDCDTFAAKSL